MLLMQFGLLIIPSACPVVCCWRVKTVPAKKAAPVMPTTCATRTVAGTSWLRRRKGLDILVSLLLFPARMEQTAFFRWCLSTQEAPLPLRGRDCVISAFLPQAFMTSSSGSFTSCSKMVTTIFICLHHEYMRVWYSYINLPIASQL
jgi:hypothetical protein